MLCADSRERSSQTHQLYATLTRHRKTKGLLVRDGTSFALYIVLEFYFTETQGKENTEDKKETTVASVRYLFFIVGIFSFI